MGICASTEYESELRCAFHPHAPTFVTRDGSHICGFPKKDSYCGLLVKSKAINEKSVLE